MNFRWISEAAEAADRSTCFLCHVKFKGEDSVIEFMGMGYAHHDCFDRKMKENAERRKSK